DCCKKEQQYRQNQGVLFHCIPRADTLGYYIVAPSGLGVSAGRISVFIDFVFVMILSGLLQKKETIPPKSRRTYT
ncbi:hypothetical protein, partial [uncultured Cyclobacterium sp.]|uniref:hypothetical protein n=1 Tax=uncultured Cyclobacterium sp. TaxID=453820 RepID=UPI0030EDDAAA